MVEVKQYDIHWINLDPTKGCEMSKTRPCVIVSPDELNRFLRTVVIVPVTSTIRSYPWRVRCIVVDKEGSMATDQIKVVDRSRIGSKLSSLSKEEVKSLKKTLIEMFID